MQDIPSHKISFGWDIENLTSGSGLHHHDSSNIKLLQPYLKYHFSTQTKVYSTTPPPKPPFVLRIK